MKCMLWALVLLSTMSSCNQADSITYYLPKNFEGVFAVVYNQMEGATKVQNGRRQFIIPENGILLTQEKFSEGWRDDIFLIKGDKGYDTLKTYIPNMDTTGKRFDKAYYKSYTRDSNALAVNFRQIRRGTFNKFDASGNKVGHCDLEYEVIAVGRASNLNDSSSKAFINRLENYFQNSLCK